MEKNEQTTLNARIAAWLQKNRLILISSAAVLVVILLTIGIISAVQNSRAEKSIEALLSFEELYTDWQAAEEGDAAPGEALEEAFSEMEDKFPGTYGYQRALFLMGDYRYGEERFEEAVDSYATLAEEFPNSYLAPLALFNAAAAQEENGNSEEASALYRRISEEYGESPLAPRALFSLGRTLEAQGSGEAVTVYTSLGERFPSSSWTKLARSRIIELNLAD